MNRRTFAIRIAAAFFLLASGISVAEEPVPVKVACIGDSITAGHGVEKRNQNCYPAQLQKLLGAKYQVRNFGVSGAAIQKHALRPYWNLKEFKTAQEWQPDIIVIKLGTNDACQDNGNWKGKATFKTDYLAFLKVLKSLESKPAIYLCTPAPAFPGDRGRREVVLKPIILPTMLEIAKEENLKLIDVFNVLIDKPKLLPDNVHPNAEGAGLIAEAIAKVITTK